MVIKVTCRHCGEELKLLDGICSKIDVMVGVFFEIECPHCRRRFVDFLDNAQLNRER